MKKLSVNDTSSASTGSRESSDPLESDFSGDENGENDDDENRENDDDDDDEEEEDEDDENDADEDKKTNDGESKYMKKPQKKDYDLDDFQILKTIGEWKQIFHIFNENL